MTCTFFGHRDTPAQIKPRLRQVITDLIEHHGVTQFNVGNQGNLTGSLSVTIKSGRMWSAVKRR